LAARSNAPTVIFQIFAPQIGRAFFPSQDPLVSSW
jgi:hypothetical protein